MSDSFVLPSLIRKRAEIAGRIEHRRETVRQLTADLAAIDAAIRPFDPNADTDAIPNRRYPLRSAATRGEMSRSVYAVLGKADEPLSNQDVALGVMQLRGLDTNDLKLAKLVTHRVAACYAAPMLYLTVKAALSGVIVAAVAEVSKRYPGLGGLIASLPLVSVLGMMWLWRDTADVERMASHSEGTFWFVLPSLPMFLVIPALLRRGVPFWPSLATGCALTVVLYALMTWLGPRFGLKL